MEVIKYNSFEELSKKAENMNQLLFDSGVSLSFRTYDRQGNTLEFHVHYIPTIPTK